jgi:dienelactone hydrolase
MKTRPYDVSDLEVPNRGGRIRCEFFRASSGRAVTYMHGIGGGTHGPANIYHPLAEALLKDDISSLLINCRHDGDLEECASDVIACISYLDTSYGMGYSGLIGWSFGGAVVIEAARDPRVKAVVTVASQSHGTQDVDRISAPILLIHGKADKTLPYDCSVDIYNRAPEPKKLVLYPGADHGISQYRDEMFNLVRDWFLDYFPR